MQQGSYEILLSKLDQFIRKYYLNQVVRGVLLFAAIVAAYYLVASLSEYTMYFPGAIRKAILAGFAFIGLSTLYLLIMKPLFGYWRLGETISHEQAAQVIGRHFSNIEDKLLNILQLKAATYPGVSPVLLEAGINQKIDSIRLVPFTSAIDLAENKKYLKYAVPPL